VVADVTEPQTTVPPPPPPSPPPTLTPHPAHDGTIRVKRWVVIALAAFAIGAIGFALGWIAAPGSSSSTAASRSAAAQRDLRDLFGRNGPFGENGPFGNGNGNNGNGNGNGNGNQAPAAPRAFLGVVTSSSSSPKGAAVERIAVDSPAGKAGLQAGDVITKVDGTTIAGPSELATAVGHHDPGAEVTITYQRDGSTKTVKVKLGDRSSADQSLEPPQSNF